MRWNDSRELVDVGIGLVGFFAFAFLLVTIGVELTGGPALGWALTLLALVLLFAVLWQARTRIAAARLRADEEADQRRQDS